MIDRFQGDYRFLSNFYLCRIPFDGLHYHSVEAAYQAQKTTDRKIQNALSFIKSPGYAKHIGQQLPLRSDWEDVKIPVMSKLIAIKFDNYGPPINDWTREAQMLVDTFPHELIEGNTWGDTFWGVCNGRGENMLGHILMRRRMELMAYGIRRTAKEEDATGPAAVFGML